MKNEMIRKALDDSGMKQWELAEILGISEFTLSRKLRHELPQEEKDRILDLIYRGKAVQSCRK